MNFKRVQARYVLARKQASELFPRVLKVPLLVVEDADLTPRSYAYCDCGHDEDTATIGIAPRLAGQPTHRIDGVLRHEIGHAIDTLYQRPESRLACDLPGHDTPELRADAIAFAVWRSPIGYDDEHVQTTDPGGPRPSWLPQ
jgi:hypothetical protein